VEGKTALGREDSRFPPAHIHHAEKIELQSFHSAALVLRLRNESGMLDRHLAMTQAGTSLE
jgi:hypothetical protein